MHSLPVVVVKQKRGKKVKTYYHMFLLFTFLRFFKKTKKNVVIIWPVRVKKYDNFFCKQKIYYSDTHTYTI
jgi:hypothetical protein